MHTTIHQRPRSDAERARVFRSTKKQRIQCDVGVPDTRDLCAAFLETNVRVLRAGKIDAAVSTKIMRSVVGCLIRDGFDRRASRAALKVVFEKIYAGPEPSLFEALPKEQV
jgi:hypothetical protein